VERLAILTAATRKAEKCRELRTDRANSYEMDRPLHIREATDSDFCGSLLHSLLIWDL